MCFPVKVTPETGSGGERKFVRKRNGHSVHSDQSGGKTSSVNLRIPPAEEPNEGQVC